MIARPDEIQIRPARGPLPSARLLTVDAQREGHDIAPIDALPDRLAPGDLIVLNDAATLPSSLSGTGPGGEAIELRLARSLGGSRWIAAVLGAGDWRTPTEDRPPPPALAPGDVVAIGPGFAAHVVQNAGPRLVAIRLEADRGEWLQAVYRSGQPVRYSYLGGPVPIGAFQTAFATRPWASEAPSAALPLSWAILLAARRTGIGLATLTHAAGLSSIDGGSIDRALPLPERSAIGEATIAAIDATRAAGHRVIAAGTTVVRALEGRFAQHGSALRAGVSETDLVIGGGFVPRVVDGLLTKIHAPDEPHFAVLAAFAPADRLEAAFADAGRRGLRNHEFGDAALLLR